MHPGLILHSRPVIWTDGSVALPQIACALEAGRQSKPSYLDLELFSILFWDQFWGTGV